MPSPSKSEIVRSYFGAYETKDRQRLESLLSDDFTFISPYDDRIDRAAYFSRCWPNSEGVRAFTLERLFEQDDEVAVRYLLELNTGKQFRNVELLRFAGGRIAEVDVYFGRTLREPSPAE